MFDKYAFDNDAYSLGIDAYEVDGSANGGTDLGLAWGIVESAPEHFENPINDDAKTLTQREKSVPNVLESALDLFQINLKQHQLLSAEEEKNLAYDIQASCAALVAELASKPATADQLEYLLILIAGNPPKVPMFDDKSDYFHFRQEYNDLVEQCDKDNLKRYLQAVLSNGNQTTIRWSPPLVITLARYFIGECSSSGSLLERSFLAYLGAHGINRRVSKDDVSPLRKTHIKQYIAHYEQLRNRMVSKNLPLVFHIAKKYSNDRVEMIDYIQEGTLGLIRAVEKFDADKGYRFSTYAYPWIETKIKNFRVNAKHVINITPDIHRHLGKLWAHIGQSSGAQHSTKALAKALDFSEDKITQLTSINRNQLSMDLTLNDGDNIDLHGMLPDNQYRPDSDCESQALSRFMIQLLDQLLSQREAYILKERFGLLGSDPRTIQNLSDIIGVSKERVRQIEGEALGKLREKMGRMPELKNIHQLLQ
ncbi:MAG: sigma-70 family RNA polymerase sigma factor [Pseudomonadota bacterium]